LTTSSKNIDTEESTTHELAQQVEDLREERDRLVETADKDAPLRPYQIELLKLQRYLERKKITMIVLFEGRDA